MLVNRDSAFLSLLGTALSPAAPEVIHTTCCNPFGKARPLVQTAPHVEYAAAVAICGLAAKLQDDAADEKGLRSDAAAFFADALHAATAKAASLLSATGFPVQAVQQALGGQVSSEDALSEQGFSGAVAATRFAYGEIFAHLPAVSGASEDQSGPLRVWGTHLGELIYFTDAWDDYARDQKRGHYNPLPPTVADRTEMAAEVVERCLSQMAEAFRSLRLHQHGSLLQPLVWSIAPSTRQRFGLLALDSTPNGEGNPPPDPNPPTLPDKKRGRRRRAEKGKGQWCDAYTCCDLPCGDSNSKGCSHCDCPSCNLPKCDCPDCDCCSGCDCSCN